MKKLFLLMTLVICALGLNAQNTKVITGAVIDKYGNPLPNALVEATGGAESVTTDADGSFRIEVPIWLKSLTAKYAGVNDKTIKLNHRNQVIFEMKPKTGSWFLDLAYTATFTPDYYTGLGLMGGYLGNWGGYAKILMAIGAQSAFHSMTVGVIKQVSKPIYLYLGAGFGEVEHRWKHNNHYDYWDGAGGVIDVGALYKINKINFGIGYSIAIGDYTNHSLQLSVGYCF